MAGNTNNLPLIPSVYDLDEQHIQALDHFYADEVSMSLSILAHYHPGANLKKTFNGCNLRVDQIPRVIHYTGLERLAMGKQSNLLGQCVSYEEN
jgi:hypothetical protein